MEVDDFSSSIDSLNSLVEEYKGLERQMNNPTPPEPRLEIFKWRRACMWASLWPVLPRNHCMEEDQVWAVYRRWQRRRLSETSTRGNLWSWYNTWPVPMAHNTRWRNSREKTIRSRDDRTSEVLFVEETYSSILNCVFVLFKSRRILIDLRYVLTLYYDMQVHKFKDNNKTNREMNRFETWIFWKHFHCVMNLCLFKRVTKNIVMCCNRILVVWLTNVIAVPRNFQRYKCVLMLVPA